jgi:hypothetical protein
VVVPISRTSPSLTTLTVPAFLTTEVPTRSIPCVPFRVSVPSASVGTTLVKVLPEFPETLM